jgi:protein-S-isoprenylcysteine O-methyltransferase Ste14
MRDYSLLKRTFSLILPATVLVLVPLTIENRWAVCVDVEFVIGILLAAAGLVVLGITASMFFRMGNGTIAPWSPTRKLVVGGPYRYVRNPMITGVLTALLGESLMIQSLPIFEWLIVFFAINNIYFVLSEEPGLAKRFGEEYLEYKRNVPRWIPRLKPWDPDKHP